MRRLSIFFLTIHFAIGYIAGNSLKEAFIIILMDSIHPGIKIMPNDYTTFVQVKGQPEFDPIVIFEAGTVISIMTDRDMSFTPFGDSNHVEDIVRNTGTDFKIQKQTFWDKFYNTKDNVYTLSYKDSFIKVLDNKDIGKYQIISAIIIDEEIWLINNIKIGISKKDFLEKVFTDISIFDIEKITTLINGDLFGDIEQSFFFENNLLVRIEMTSSIDVESGQEIKNEFLN